MIPSISKLLTDLQDQLDEMSDTELEAIIKAGDNSIVEISNIAEMLSAHASVLGDTDSSVKPSDWELSCILYNATHTLQNIRAMLDLAAEASYKQSQRAQKNPTK